MAFQYGGLVITKSILATSLLLKLLRTLWDNYKESDRLRGKVVRVAHIPPLPPCLSSVALEPTKRLSFTLF